MEDKQATAIPMQFEQGQSPKHRCFTSKKFQESKGSESQKKDPAPNYISQVHAKLMDCIKNGDLDGLTEIIIQLQMNLTSFEISQLLNSLDENSRHTPLTLAKTLTDYKTKRNIIALLKKNGVPQNIGTKNFRIHLQDLDNTFLETHKQLMHSILEGSLEDTISVLEDACTNRVPISLPIDTIDFQLLVLLNESDQETGHTPLTLATENGLLDRAKLLLRAGAFPRQVNKNGNKPEDIAKRQKSSAKDEFLKIFNTKKTFGEVSEEYLTSPAHLKILADSEKKLEAKKNKRKALFDS